MASISVARINGWGNLCPCTAPVDRLRITRRGLRALFFLVERAAILRGVVAAGSDRNHWRGEGHRPLVPLLGRSPAVVAAACCTASGAPLTRTS
jgi:hypothetical protein